MATEKTKNAKPTDDYSAKNLEVLEGLDAVRMRPGMYIGSTGIKGLHHILWEIVDNAVDEAANGFATRITVTLHQDGSASVEDNGRGIPTDIHPKEKVSGVQLAPPFLTRLPPFAPSRQYSCRQARLQYAHIFRRAARVRCTNL